MSQDATAAEPSRPGPRRAGIAAALVAASVVWGLAASPPLPAQPAAGAVPPAPGTGRLVASGTLTAVDPGAAAVTLAITGSARLERFEGGSTWRQSAMTGPRLVRLLPVTLLLDSDARPIPMSSLRAGDPASVWAVVGADSSIRAITLMITAPRTRVPAVQRAGDAAPAAAGAVLQRSGRTLVLLTASGARRSVVLTQATVVAIGGRPGKGEAIAVYDIVRVGGVVNSDGSVAATRIDVDFDAASGATVAGPVEEQIGGLGGLVVQGTMVCTSAETYVISRGARGTIAELAPARAVAVYGTPMKDGATPVGLQARVVVVR